MSLIWNGRHIQLRLQTTLRNKIIRATNTLRRELRTTLDIAGWGSRNIGGGLRVRFKSSPPGSIPLKQTRNLRDSFKTEFGHTAKGEFAGSVYTDVPYAPTLEFGGTLQLQQHEKIYTERRLVNPPEKPLTIAARPFFMPTVIRAFIKLKMEVSR